MNLSLGEYVVIPNHFHAIIGIGENKYNSIGGRDAMHRVSTINNGDAMHIEDAMHRVSTATIGNKFGPQSKNLASIVRGFKSSVTKYARIIQSDFQWQSLYYDQMIRNEKSLQRISNYIINNPANWNSDKLYL